MAAPTTALPPAPPAPARRRFTSKHTLWLFMGLAALFVFITTELFLAFDYPLYHPYRLQLVHDRVLLIPHALFGTTLIACFSSMTAPCLSRTLSAEQLHC